MKLLIDMNLSPRWMGWLQAEGLEAVHWSSVGRANAPDSEIMAYARESGFFVLTHDLDFGSILAATQGKSPSVVQMRTQDVTPEAMGVHVLSALRQLIEELNEGALVTIDAKKTRLRVLPLH